jgi:hypothetical protein
MFILPEPVRADDTLDGCSLSGKGAFTKNRISLEILQGLFTDIDLGPETPDFEYTQTILRLGWIPSYSPSPSRFLPEGNWEVIFEVCRSTVTAGPGNYMSGFSALVRYNFTSPGRRFIPYIQGGAGILFNDVYKDRSQDAIGQDLEFTPQLGLGIQYVLTKNWSIIAEGKCHHISNAGLNDRNDGMNSLGASIGFAYLF